MTRQTKDLMIMVLIASAGIALFMVAFYFGIKHSVEEDQQEFRTACEKDLDFCERYFPDKQERGFCLLRMREIRSRGPHGHLFSNKACTDTKDDI